MKSKPLALAGNSRSQEANRKRLTYQLRLLERANIREAHRAANLAGALASLDVATITTKGSGAIRLLKRVAKIDDFEVRLTLCRFLGIEWRVLRESAQQSDLVTQLSHSEDYAASLLLKDHIRGKIDLRAAVANVDYCCPKSAQRDLTLPATTAEPVTVRPLTADAALKEAASIAIDAADAETDIDWTQNPDSDRERDLRIAIIRRVVAKTQERSFEFMSRNLARIFPGVVKEEHEDELARTKSVDAYSIVHALRGLLSDPYTEFIGSDLYDAIEHWQTISKVEKKRAGELKRKRLIREARRDLRGEGK
jgi:hypothetical protein